MDADTGTRDITPFLEAALEEVVETIMDFGQWPQPRKVGLFITSGSTKPKEFDLYDFLDGEHEVTLRGYKYTPRRMDHSDLLEYFILSMADHNTAGEFQLSRSRWEKKVTAMLNDHLKDSTIVAKVAAKLEQEDREENT